MDQDSFNNTLIKKLTTFVNAFTNVEFERRAIRTTLNNQIGQYLTTDKGLKAALNSSRETAKKNLFRENNELKRENDELKAQINEMKKQKLSSGNTERTKEREDLSQKTQELLIKGSSSIKKETDQNETMNDSDDEILLNASQIIEIQD